MSRSSWIIIILITILLVSSYWFSRNREAPDWVKCKESLFEQVVFKKCTPSVFNRPNLKILSMTKNLQLRILRIKSKCLLIKI